VGGVDYDRAAADFHHTRGHTADLAAWRAPVVGALGGAPPGPVVDLGAGTGAWSAALAGWSGRRVMAVEPSDGMRAEFAGGDGVGLVAGRGGAVPVRAGAGGAAWLSTVIHHVDDLAACARDLRRVLAPGAPVLVRSAFPERDDGIPIIRYFTAARRALARFPTVAATRAAFEAAGFGFGHLERVEAAPVELRHWREMLPRQRHADTVLVDMSDAEFAAGLAAVDAAIAAGRTTEVVGIDLLTFR
jgi:SAM-dependent methyltransferase